MVPPLARNTGEFCGEKRRSRAGYESPTEGALKPESDNSRLIAPKIRPDVADRFPANRAGRSPGGALGNLSKAVGPPLPHSSPLFSVE